MLECLFAGCLYVRERLYTQLTHPSLALRQALLELLVVGIKGEAFLEGLKGCLVALEVKQRRALS